MKRILGLIMFALPLLPSHAQSQKEPSGVEACDSATYADARTSEMGFINENRKLGVEIAFWKLTARDKVVWGPYIKTTGTFPQCQNVPIATNCLLRSL